MSSNYNVSGVSCSSYMQKVMPLIYDDSLTYYENICKLIQYVNRILDGYEVLHYADPMQWSITNQYTQNTVVINKEGTAYISKQPVPEGIGLDNTNYWIPIFNYGVNIDTLRSQICHNNTTHDTFDIDLKDDMLVFYNGLLYRTTKDVTAGDKIIEGKNVVKTTVEEAINFYPVYTEEDENLLFKGSAPEIQIVALDHEYDSENETMTILNPVEG